MSLRLRVFAGPNGSGKSTVIGKIKKLEFNGRTIDFGYYINADDIANSLRNKGFSFDAFELRELSSELFIEAALASGLIGSSFSKEQFMKSFAFEGNSILLLQDSHLDRLAQVTADFLRKRMLTEKKKFSFETVFSHQSKLEIMREAALAGYKVYFYYVSTQSPEINKMRVSARVKKGGHNVPAERIESRYYRSLDLLYQASQICHQAFFFDNSTDGEEAKMFSSFKKENDVKKWNPKPDSKELPNWFIEFYSKKIPR